MMLEVFNAGVVLALSLVAGWGALSNKTRTNLAVHVGLAFVALGFFGTFLMAFGPFTSVSAIEVANAIVHSGLVLCAIGYVQRVNRKGPCRRVSDWVDLQDESKGERHGTK